LEPEKQAFGGVWVASAAHELRTPVEAMMNLIHLLDHNPSLDAIARSYVQQLDNELTRMRHIITQILDAHRQPANPTLVSLSDVLETIFRFYNHKVAFKQIQIDKRYECDGLVKALVEDLRQVFSNLVVNALEALRLNGRLTVHIYRSRDWSNVQRAGVRVVIADNGPGILPQHRDKIMSEPFFTTKGEKGTGLGL